MDYEKAYKEALEKARSLKDEYNEIEGCYPNQWLCEELFPELAESEDEKIRKGIFKALSKKDARDVLISQGVEVSDALAWLEKQKEKSLITDDKDVEKAAEEYRNFRMACGIKDPNELSEIEEAFYEGAIRTFDRMKEQKSIEWDDADENTLLDTINTLRSCGRCSTDRALWLMSLKDRCCPQKQYKWTEEDIVMHNDCICAINAANEADYTNKEKERLTNWLKSLKPQPKQEWSEEDIMMKGEIINVLQKTGNYEKEINWLKSLKDRVQPQPKQEWSEEDEEILKEIITDVRFEGYNNDLQANSYRKINWLKSLRPQNTWKPSDKHN